jgi:hypothetical protein
MARRPFFGSSGAAPTARMDMRAATAPGRAYAAAFESLGDNIGGMIQQYGLNKERRNKLEATLEGQLSADPSIVQQLTMTGDETSDKKNMALFQKVRSGDASIADLERANGLLAGKTTQENAMLKKKVDELNFSMQEALKDPTISKAVSEAQVLKARANYADSIASAEYAEKIADAELTRAQTEYYDAKSKAEQNSETYTPGQRVDVEGISGNKVSFVWTGSSLQPLNDSISKKSIEEAIIRGVDPAAMQVYLEDNYDYDEDTESYTFKGKSNMVGYGGGQKDPMMEQAITILGMRPKVKDDTSSTVSNQKESVEAKPTVTTQEEFDALPSGTIYIGKDGKRRKKP